MKCHLQSSNPGNSWKGPFSLSDIDWKQLIKAYLHGMWAHWGNRPDPCNTVSLLHPMAPHPRKQRCCSPKAYFPQAHVAGSASKSRNEKSSSVSTETWKRDSFVYLWTLRVHTHTHINHTNTHTQTWMNTAHINDLLVAVIAAASAEGQRKQRSQQSTAKMKRVADSPQR